MRSLEQFFPARPAPGRTGDAGLFGPGSTAWRVARERIVLAGGPAALLLQVAHPLVGEGVRSHSAFATDPLRRLRGTLDAVLTVTFGDLAQVRSTVQHVALRHRPVRGALPHPSASLPAGTAYRASDPELSLWVFATLVWSALEVTEAFLRPITAEERDAYYHDMRQFARLFGVTDALLPADYAGLDRYVEHHVRTVLDVGPTARLISGQVLAPDPPLLARPLRRIPSLLAAGLLPPALREAYALPWRGREQVAFAVVRRMVRLAIPLLPTGVRYWPHYLVARERTARTAD